MLPFLHREEDQNSARTAALASAAPAGADAMAPSQYLASKAAQIDQAGDLAQQRILQHAQDLAAALGPGQSADDNGAVVQSALGSIDASGAATDAANVAQARQAASVLGGGDAPEMNGQTIRAAMEAAKQSAQTMRSNLYDPAVLDPNDNIALVTAPAAAAGKTLAGSLDPLGADPSPDVARIMGKMQALPARRAL